MIDVRIQKKVWLLLFGKSLFSLVIIGFGFFILSVTILPISQRVNELRTDTQQDTGLGCTGTAANECLITLSNKSAYEPIAPNWTVTETSPGSVDRTAQAVLDSNLQNVTISGVVNGTPYVFTVDYYKVNTSVGSATHLDSILKRFNLILVVGTMAVLVVGVGISFNYGSIRFG